MTAKVSSPPPSAKPGPRLVSAARLWGALAILCLAPRLLQAHHYSIRDETDQHACGLASYNGTECNTNCQGLVRWWVSEPFLSVWLEDEPLGYQPSRGPRVAFHLSYKQRNDRPEDAGVFTVGRGWECSWRSHVQVRTFQITATQPAVRATWAAEVWLPGGGRQGYAVTNQLVEEGAQLSAFISQARLVPALDGSLNLLGFDRVHPDGARDLYRALQPSATETNYFLSNRSNAAGHGLTFYYQTVSNVFRLTSVVDVDGRSTILRYLEAGHPNRVTEAADPFGRTNRLHYSASGDLTNIVDPEGLFSRLRYETNGFVKELVTPYGTTTFLLQGTSSYLGGAKVARSVIVFEPENQIHAYVYSDYSTDLVPDAYGHAPPPSASLFGTFENSELRARNSFFWGPRQAPSLPADLHNLNHTNCWRARVRHWLRVRDFEGEYVSPVLSMERAPAPSGYGEGQTTWYDYAGKGGLTNYEGTNSLPGAIAYRPPAEPVRFTWYLRNALGLPTNVVETWSESDTLPNPLPTRTNRLVYATNGFDLVGLYGPGNERLAGYAYNHRHQVTHVTNALGEVTTLTYNALGQPQTIDFRSGLRRTYSYHSSGAYLNWLQAITDTPVGGQHSFDYSNGLVRTWTDARGLTRTFTWDRLQRVASIAFPDQTSVSNRYQRLDLAGTRDRLGQWTTFGYDGLGRLRSITNALTNVTALSYCDCGSLESITDPEQRTTTFLYDAAGRYLGWANSELVVTNKLDLPGRITAEHVGSAVTSYAHTAHNLPARAENVAGPLWSRRYDSRDRPVQESGRVGYTLTNLFDPLDRLVQRVWPNGTLETFVHRTNALAAYTNRAGAGTHFARDAAGQLLFVTNAEGHVTAFAYNPAGDLERLTDGNRHPTTWSYDAYGRVRAKTNALNAEVQRWDYDAHGRVTSRWTPAGGSTTYRYDAADRLTNITYAGGTTPAVTFRYNRAGELTNLVDGVGTSRFSHTALGLLRHEDGPWLNDALTNTYSEGLRTRQRLDQPGAPPWTDALAYDNHRRLLTLTTPAGPFGYHYPAAGGPVSPAADWVARVDYPGGAAATNIYDGLGQLRQRDLLNALGQPVRGHTYAYNAAGQRTNVPYIPKRSWDCAYDGLGQLRAAQPVQDEGVRYPHELLSWEYDAAQNVLTRSKGGVPYTFHVDAANRLVSLSRPATLTVRGLATNNAVWVTVNGVSGTVSNDGTFTATGVPVSDGTNTFTALGQDRYYRKATNVVSLYLPPTRTFSSDANGNLLSDGERFFAYDAENRLTNMVVSNAWRTTLAYDGLGRRRIRREYTWTNSAWRLTNEVRYLYDGLLVLQERDSNNVPRVTYTRGVDLSGTFQGAGGIGGRKERRTTWKRRYASARCRRSDGIGAARLDHHRRWRETP